MLISFLLQKYDYDPKKLKKVLNQEKSEYIKY